METRRTREFKQQRAPSDIEPMTDRGSLRSSGEMVRHHRGALARRLPIGIGLVGVFLTLGSFAALWNGADGAAEERLATQALTVVQSAAGALDHVDATLVSLSGLFRSSVDVTPVEFSQFTNDVGLEPGMAGIGYLLKTDAAELAFVEEHLRSQTGGEVIAFEMDTEGLPTELGLRSEYYLVQYVSPHEEWAQLVGLDLGSVPLIESALRAAVDTRQAAMTTLFDLPGQTDRVNFAMFRVVISPVDDEPTAVVVALMDFSELIEANIPAAVAPYVRWDFAEIGENAKLLTGTTAELRYGDRTWVISVSATANSPFAANREASYVALGLGLLASFLAAFSLLLVGQRIESDADLASAQGMTDAKDRFIASISHELRTPLTSVLGFAEILRDGQELSPQERVAMMKAITEEATDLAHIIDDLLVAARGEIGQIVVTRVQISMRDELNAVAAASGLGDQISIIESSGESELAIGDPNRVRQILRNLVENARRYGGGHIEIEVMPDGDRIRVEVRDDGSGVPISVLDRLFEPYQQFAAVAGVTESLGLGLSVSAQLAKLMQGGLTHERRGGWTVFSLFLPAIISEEPASAGKWTGVSRSESFR